MQKKTIIKAIREKIKEFGNFTTADVEASSSPCIVSLGKDSHQLAEKFNFNGVIAVTYVHETEVDENPIDYEDLNKEILEEIMYLAFDYEADQIRTQKRCSN